MKVEVVKMREEIMRQQPNVEIKYIDEDQYLAVVIKDNKYRILDLNEVEFVLLNGEISKELVDKYRSDIDE